MAAGANAARARTPGNGWTFLPQSKQGSANRGSEKLGFRLEGTRREALIWDGEAVDAHIMSLLKREYSGASPTVG
ncbi:GNAT family N-acetyltransferase [Mesorhizobium sp. B2-4-19]|uniref:GNAT family N-acetyltransferase n=1 Tax=Mesorhizobium sp. B2-4-19 TaxID=2589930 RepID=UPI00112B27D9|nr:GNAT family protein [Mesorhizobium sp. B2-4-19]TPK63556.1 GNAT family N-acetyltransferase [Mesorhizobium sp. B2-4-19]